MNSGRNWGRLVCAVALPLAVLAYFYGPALAIYYNVKQNVKEDPSFARVPEPLSTNKTAQAAGQKLELYGVEFQVPWSGKVQRKELKRLVRVQFQDGQFVLMFDPSQRVDRIKVLHENGRGYQAERMFGSDVMRSNYALMNAVLRVTPKDISPWMPRVQLVRNSVFLMLKEAELANTQTGLFQFQNERLKGFQRGDPSKSPVVDLDAFDEEDREYDMFVGTTKGTSGLVSQEDINLILSTLKPMQPIPQLEQKSPAASGTN